MKKKGQEFTNNIYTCKTMRPYFKFSIILLILVSFLSETQGQDKSVIVGYVYSATENLPLEGIKVSAKHRRVNSVTTDATGLFEIEITDPGNARAFMLIFSYPQYEEKEQYGTPKETMEVHLSKSGENIIDNSLYFPYQNKKQSNMTGAAENVDIEYSSQVLSSSLEQLLENSSAQVSVHPEYELGVS